MKRLCQTSFLRSTNHWLPRRCGGKEIVTMTRCMNAHLWGESECSDARYLDSVTLADLVEQQNQKANASRTSVAVVLHDSRLQTRAKKPMVFNERPKGNECASDLPRLLGDGRRSTHALLTRGFRVARELRQARITQPFIRLDSGEGGRPGHASRWRRWSIAIRAS